MSERLELAKIALLVCVRTGLPLAWRIETAKRNESLFVAPLLDACRARGLQPTTAAMDKGYDNERVHAESRERGCVAVVPIRKGRKPQPRVIPNGTDEWFAIYRGRGAVEREFGRLKHEYGFAPLRVRGLARARLHADLTMLARLAQALGRARAVPLAA